MNFLNRFPHPQEVALAISLDQDIYAFVEAARARGPIAKGILETVRLLERGKAKTVIVAENVNPPQRLDIVRDLCREKGVPLYGVSDKLRLGTCAGLEVGASCVAMRLEMK